MFAEKHCNRQLAILSGCSHHESELKASTQTELATAMPLSFRKYSISFIHLSMRHVVGCWMLDVGRWTFQRQRLEGIAPVLQTKLQCHFCSEIALTMVGFGAIKQTWLLCICSGAFKQARFANRKVISEQL